MKNKFLLINKKVCLLLLLLIVFLLGVTAVSATGDNTTSVEVEDKIVKDTSSTNDASLLKEVKTSDTKEVKDTHITTKTDKTTTKEKKTKTLKQTKETTVYVNSTGSGNGKTMKTPTT